MDGKDLHPSSEQKQFLVENFTSSFEQVISGPFEWYWNFDHQFAGSLMVGTEVGHAIFAEFGKKSALKFSHSYDSQGNIQYSTIEEGPVYNGGKYYLYELDEESYIKKLFVKNSPNGQTLRVWTYIYDDDRKVISKIDEHKYVSSKKNKEIFLFNESSQIVTWKIESEIDNKHKEAFFMFNQDDQVTKFVDFYGEEARFNYNDLGYVSSINFIRADQIYFLKFEYSPQDLKVTTYRDSLLTEVKYYTSSMSFKSLLSYIYEDQTLDFVIESVPSAQSELVEEEVYVEIKEDRSIVKGSSRLVWKEGTDVKSTELNEKTFYDLNGNLLYIYVLEGQGGKWINSDGTFENELQKIPLWLKKFAAFNSLSSQSNFFYSAEGYNVLSY
ncbi:hypothetical protein GCM10011506_42320 [Marivirga lumbricoides]|uniref:Uncharacterized protein n=2 Tax=Marivirga lumbricoides TaxID=1046115 RepID=A0ABQ1N327_9BACT|nr:hypothetical protein GCM10011506_42320 [Marivirga lumbricoides]